MAVTNLPLYIQTSSSRREKHAQVRHLHIHIPVIDLLHRMLDRDLQFLPFARNDKSIVRFHKREKKNNILFADPSPVWMT